MNGKWDREALFDNLVRFQMQCSKIVILSGVGEKECKWELLSRCSFTYCSFKHNDCNVHEVFPMLRYTHHRLPTSACCYFIPDKLEQNLPFSTCGSTDTLRGSVLFGPQRRKIKKGWGPRFQSWFLHWRSDERWSVYILYMTVNYFLDLKETTIFLIVPKKKNVYRLCLEAYLKCCQFKCWRSKIGLLYISSSVEVAWRFRWWNQTQLVN